MWCLFQYVVFYRFSFFVIGFCLNTVFVKSSCGADDEWYSVSILMGVVRC